MRLVIDTNVFVSGVFFSGKPHQILDAWRRGEIELILSSEILAEYQATGRELAHQFRGTNLTPWLELVVSKATMVATRPLDTPVCADPDDDKFIACALARGAKVIATGDKALLRVSGHEGIEVLTPRQLVARYLQAASR